MSQQNVHNGAARSLAAASPAEPTPATTSGSAPAPTGLRGELAAIKRVWPLLEVSRGRLARAILLGAGALGAAVGLAAVSAYLIARASQMPYVLELTAAAVAVRFFGIARPLLRYLERLASHSVALRGMASLRSQVYERLASTRTDHVSSLRRGDVLARMGADVDSVGDLVVRSLLPAIVAAVVTVITTTVVAAFSPLAGAWVAGCLLLSGVVGPLLAMRSARRAELSRQGHARTLSALMQDALLGSTDAVVSGQMPALNAKRAELEEKLVNDAEAAARPAAGAAALDQAALALCVIGTVLIGAPQVSAGVLDPVHLAIVVLTPLAAFEAVALLPTAAVQWVRSAGAAGRVLDLLGPAADATAHAHPEAPADSGDHTSAGSETGAPLLSARELAAAWPGGRTVVEGIDLELRAGQAVAIAGPSGIGKTTLLLTLAGLLEPAGGNVVLAGKDAYQLTRTAAGQVATFTAEDAHIFATTLYENLRVARADLTRQEATELLEQVGLGDWLAALPDGLDTHLGADAAAISGGERRRVLLARALASPAPVLLVDEPAEHLDPQAAARLVTDLLRLKHSQKRAVVLSTHHLSALAGADQVILLGTDPAAMQGAAGRNVVHPTGAETGPARVTARGSHANLIAAVDSYRAAVEAEAAQLRAEQES
ncbi:thiol reductant ABC exporter subunit CydC [Buchananella felis]|uniref:thiol reductant ABC exporter subunit CydC n=1 Tax=Buchananella felis TaxID=3231492 RepID=UPI00352731AA